ALAGDRSRPYSQTRSACGLQVVGADGAAVVALAALDGAAEQVVDLVGNGLDQLAIAAETRVADDILDLAADDEDFLGCLVLAGCHCCSFARRSVWTRLWRRSREIGEARPRCSQGTIIRKV